MTDADWSLIPEHCRGGLERYIYNRILPGDFLTAVLCNDLHGACERADDINRHALFQYVQFLYLYAPRGCWGSPDAVKNWIKQEKAPCISRSTLP